MDAARADHRSRCSCGHHRCCVRHMPRATAGRPKLLKPLSPGRRSPAKGTCGRAPKPSPFAAKATSRRRGLFRRPARARLLAMRRSRARTRLILSTTVRPVSGRAVLRRPRGGQRRPRANRSARDWSMPNKMLVDATHPEETRVVVLRGHRVEEFDFESASRKQLRGNIYLAKVTRVEPSLQAAFVDYGGNRHGFLAFSEIHPDYYQI